MIRYALKCGKGHEFEGWFRNSDAFDRQAKRGAVACTQCGNTKVTKALMAPKIARHRKRDVAPAAAVPAAAPPAPQPVATAAALPPDVPPQIVEVVRRLREEITKSAEYVGPRFTEEARRMHYEEADRRGIYGEASLEEARELLEEGIEILPLPRLPEDHN